MNWLKLGAVFTWIETYWLRITVALLIFSTFIWMRTGEDLVRGFFYSLQFIVLNKELGDEDIPSACLLYLLTFTQFALPFTASVALLGSLFEERITPYWIRREVNKLDGHHVVLGYGALGKALAKALRKSGATVLAVDLATVTRAEAADLLLLQGDARSATLIEDANLAGAEAIYLLLPDERDNLAILEKLRAHSEQLKRKQKIHIRTHSRDLGRLFADWAGPAAADPNSPLDIRPFNPFDVVARGLVNQYSPDRYEPTDRTGSIAQTIMIVGTSAVAESLLLRFARIGIYSPKGKLRVIWAAQGASQAFSRIATDYPALDPASHPPHFWGDTSNVSDEFRELILPPIEIVTIDAPATIAVRSGQLEAICQKQLPAAVYVCHDDDIRNAIEARDLQAALSSNLPLTDNRLILAIQSTNAIRVANADTTRVLKLLPYRIAEVSIDTIFAETLAHDKADDFAMAYQAAYAKKAAIDRDAWHREHFFIKESNRDLADHLALKARYAGIDAATVDCAIRGKRMLNAMELQRLDSTRSDLVAMEQLRYRAFMFMSGFSHGQRRFAEPILLACQPTGKSAGDVQKEVDRSLRLNATLLVESLSDYELAKDTNIVEISIMALSNQLDSESVASPSMATS